MLQGPGGKHTDANPPELLFSTDLTLPKLLHIIIPLRIDLECTLHLSVSPEKIPIILNFKYIPGDVPMPFIVQHVPVTSSSVVDSSEPDEGPTISLKT